MTYSADDISPAFDLGIATETARPSLGLPQFGGVLKDIRAIVATLAAPIVRRYRVRRTTRMLLALDEAALRDIGLDRSQIMWAARHAVMAAGHRV